MPLRASSIVETSSVILLPIFSRKTLNTSFSDLISFSDAAVLKGLNESTLRKAVEYGKLVPGIDVCNLGKQWVITKEALEREYPDK